MAELKLSSTIGFSGQVQGGLIAHPDGVHIIYPLGSILVVMEKGKPTSQRFLTGHNTEISCIAVSNSGKYIASGQTSPIDQDSLIILWDFDSLSPVAKWNMHRDSVISLSFSVSDKYLASLGGDDRIVVWDVKNKKGFTASKATLGSTGSAKAVAFSNRVDSMLISCGEVNLRFWTIDESVARMTAENAKLDQIKRTINTLVVDDSDKYVYCGTTTGDILQVSIQSMKLIQYGPKKMLGQGITAVAVAPWGDLVVGSGCGKVAVLDPTTFQTLAQCDVRGRVTSVSLVKGTNTNLICGTSESNIYSINTDSFKPSIMSKGHAHAINDVFFPELSSDIFCTCSQGGFHVWNSRTYQELLRVNIPRSECLCITVPADGKVIITGWADGRIKGYTPMTGKEMWVINDAHLNGVTAMACNGSRLITGGMTGDICVWDLLPRQQKLVKTLKEHHQKVTQIKFISGGNEFISSSHDGSVIIWNAAKLTSRQSFMAQTFFNGADFHDETGIVLTASSDKRIVFWDGFNASIIREIEASLNSQPNSVCISPDGKVFVTGGDEKLVKLWDFETGELIKTGKGHSGNIKKVIFSPDQSIIVSVGGEGGIYIWTLN